MIFRPHVHDRVAGFIHPVFEAQDGIFHHGVDLWAEVLFVVLPVHQAQHPLNREIGA